jgi:DNA adenine methylase
MTRPQKIHAPLGVDFDTALKAIADESKPETESVGARPFLKWVGGKRSILAYLLARMPETYETYRESFVGGGALFFAVQPMRAYLSDINFHLMLTYQAVRDDVDRLLLNLKVHEKAHGKEYFQAARERLAHETDTTKLAALVIYLNKTCFNGLYRVNREGKFNVPMGSYSAPAIYDEVVLKSDSQVLQGVELKQHPFWQTPVCREDFYYLDPPYHQVYANYDSSGFADKEHKRLAEFCRELDEAKAFFMLSNSDTPFIRSLYAKFHIEEVAAVRSVSCKGQSRGRETELVIRNYQ